jgi:hypothetical protein
MNGEDVYRNSPYEFDDSSDEGYQLHILTRTTEMDAKQSIECEQPYLVTGVASKRRDCMQDTYG